jgi:hypothetical protein
LSFSGTSDVTTPGKYKQNKRFVRSLKKIDFFWKFDRFFPLKIIETRKPEEGIDCRAKKRHLSFFPQKSRFL